MINKLPLLDWLFLRVRVTISSDDNEGGRHVAAGVNRNIQLQHFYLKVFVGGIWPLTFLWLRLSSAWFRVRKPVYFSLAVLALDVKADELDVQSMLVTNLPPADSAPQNMSNGTAQVADSGRKDNLLLTLCEKIRAHAKKCLEKRPLRNNWDMTAELTFGRYDARLTWTGITPEEFQDIFLTLPADCYHKLQHLAHGVGWPIALSGKSTASDTEPFLFTRIDLAIH